MQVNLGSRKSGGVGEESLLMNQASPVILGDAGKSLFWCHGNRVLRIQHPFLWVPTPTKTAEHVAVMST